MVVTAAGGVSMLYPYKIPALAILGVGTWVWTLGVLVVGVGVDLSWLCL